MEHITYFNGGYDILNNDIMILQDQITPVYKRSDNTSTEDVVISAEEEEEEEKDATVGRALEALTDKRVRLVPGRKYNSEQFS